MPRRRLFAFSFALLLVLPVSAAPLVDGKEELVGRIDAQVVEAMTAPGAVGLSVAVAIGDEILLSRGYGLAEAEHGVPANAQTMFRIGSITKQYTAAAIVRLSEQWKVNFDEDIKVYLPDYESQGHTVTVRHLLTHTSGIPSYTGLGEVFWRDTSVEISHAEMTALWEDLPFEFEPGALFAYNNSGYYMLGMIIENVSGQPYAEYVSAEFFEPLGLARTRHGSNTDLIPNRAQGYRIIDGELANDGLIAMGRPGAAGALLASAGDLVRWQLALVSGKVVEPESYEEMTTPFILNDGSETSYGFGLFFQEIEGRPVVRHGGGIYGFNSDLIHVPEEQISVAVISNCEGFRSQAVSTTITQTVLEHIVSAAEAVSAR